MILWNKRGFTLIELMVVIVIIGMLAGIALPMYSKVRDKARDTEVRRNLDVVNTALAQFATDHNGLYPYRLRVATSPTGNEIATSDVDNFYPLGLIGGVLTVDQQGTPRQSYIEQNLVQPRLDGINLYQYFNQYTDPLVALGYLNRYPRNPFFPRDERPMGAMAWAFLPTDVTIPAPEVIVTPGDFVYTSNLGDAVAAAGNLREDPKSLVPRAINYEVEMPSSGYLYFKLDLVDTYQIWVYGTLHLNGAAWVAYPNNDWAPTSIRRAATARKDWNGNGTKDMFERGIAVYYSGGSKYYEQTTSTGTKIEF